MRIAVITLSIFLFSCTVPEKRVESTKRNFALVNLSIYFPVIDYSSLPKNYDSVGLSCDKCLGEDKQKIYFGRFYSDKTKNRFCIIKPGWSPYHCVDLDSNGRIKKEYISSCYEWEITYSYLDTLNYIYQYSTIEGRKTDTSIYQLDHEGRIVNVSGIEYDDLYTRKFIKKVYYKKEGHIPDSMSIVYTRQDKINEKRKVKFYQSLERLDSLEVESQMFSKYENTKDVFTNYFDRNEVFTGRNFSNSKMGLLKLVVEQTSSNNGIETNSNQNR